VYYVHVGSGPARVPRDLSGRVMKPYVHLYAFSLRISKSEAHEQWNCTVFGSQKDSFFF
jgi:hypothetical protein